MALLSTDKVIIRTACWTIANLVTCGSHMIEKLMHYDIYLTINELIQCDNYDIREECAWIISNTFVTAWPGQIHTIHYKYKIIEPYLKLLVNMNDVTNILMILKGLVSFLSKGDYIGRMICDNKFAEDIENCGGLEILEGLQKNNNKDVYENVVSILTKYFDAYEDGDKNKHNDEDEYTFDF